MEAKNTKEEVIIKCIQEEHPEFDPEDMSKEEYGDLVRPILKAMEMYKDYCLEKPEPIEPSINENKMQE